MIEIPLKTSPRFTENFGQPMAREENGRKSDSTVLNNPKKRGEGARNLKNQKHLKKESIREPTFAEYVQLTKHFPSQVLTNTLLGRYYYSHLAGKETKAQTK